MMIYIIIFILSGFIWVPVGFAIAAMLTIAKQADEQMHEVFKPEGTE